MSHAPNRGKFKSLSATDQPLEGQDWATFAGERARREAAARRESVERSLELEPQRKDLAEALGSDPVSRRTFLQNTGLLTGGLVAGAAGSFAPPANATGAPRIAIVGAGLAGLTAAYRIYKSKGWIPTVYESSARVGGRVRTIRGMANGQTAEGGAGAIDARAKTVKRLARELGLWPLVDTWVNLPAGPDLYYFGGEFRDVDELDRRQRVDDAAAGQVWKNGMGFIPQWNRSNAFSRRMDRMTVLEYLEQNSRFSGDSALMAMQRTMLEASWGGSIEQMSALMYLLANADIFGNLRRWNERFEIPGGNDTLATALQYRIPPGALRLGMHLVAIRQRANGTVTLTFAQGSSTTEVTVDKAIIAIPPPVLKKVDLSRAGFDARMMQVINRLKLGGNSKLNFQFSRNVWGAQGRSGTAKSDKVTGWSWQLNHQAYEPATHICFNNRDYGAAPAHGVAPPAVVASTLAAIDRLYPGASSYVIPGQTYLDFWAADPLAMGSYAYYAPGAMTDYADYERVPQGSVHFAGEHTAPFIERGYMNGAVISGERVAMEITGNA